MFVDGLAYDDDIVLIAPTSHAMRRMLFTYYCVADDFSIVFNAKKSNCLIVEPARKAGSFINQKPAFYMRLLTNDFILVTLFNIVLMMMLICHLVVIQW